MLSELIQRGGPIMYILLGCSVVSVSVILERLCFWIIEKRRNGGTKACCLIADGLENQDQLFKENTFLEKVSYLQKQGENKALSKLLRKESERAYERSTKNLTALDTVVSIAPLLGILGTVLGIMKSFHALDLKHLTSTGEVSHGLAEAMITTATGLAIAVPTLVFYNIFHSMAARHAANLYKLSEDLDDTLLQAIDEPES